MPRPFRLDLPKERLAALQVRLDQVAWPDQPPGEEWATGTSLAFMRDLVAYWRDGFDWRARERSFNELPQFTVDVGREVPRLERWRPIARPYAGGDHAACGDRRGGCLVLAVSGRPPAEIAVRPDATGRRARGPLGVPARDAAAAALGRADADATPHAAMAKRLATDTGRVANEALQLLGGYGYLAEYGVEKIVRDLRVHQLLEGINEIMRMIVARSMIGR